MADALRNLRLSKQIPAKDMVAVVRQLYPKYDKTVQSKCENSDAYGVSIRSDALTALYAKFAPELLEARSPPKKDYHRLPCRISARLSKNEYALLQQHLRADDISMQEWITAAVRSYLGGDIE